MSTAAKEYRWVLSVSLLILALSSVPIIAGYVAQTSDQRFIGTVFDRQDYAVHLAAMHYGEQGHWNYQFRFTTEAQTITYLKTIYIALGHLARWTGLPAELIFQVARLLFSGLACFSIYYLMSRVFAKISERRLAFVLAILGAGLGWMQMPLGLNPNHNISPMDFWLIDAYVFFDMLTLPHLSLMIAAMAFSVAVFLNHIQRPRGLNLVVLAVCANLVQIVSPIAFVIVDAALAGIVALVCWRKRRVDWTLVFMLGLLVVTEIPLMGYSLLLMTQDPAWVEFNRQNITQNITLSPPPVYLLFGFGLFWPFALIGAIKTLRQQDEKLGWAMAWIVFAVGAAYLPVAIQRRFLLGLTIPLAALATPAILEFSNWLQQHSSLNKLSGALLIASLTVMTPLLMISAYSLDMSRRPAALFEPTSLVQATDWLTQHGTEDQVVLGSEPTAQLVGIRTPLTLYFGHPTETLFYAGKAQGVERFYRGEQPANWLESQGIDWVIWGPHEKNWGLFPSGLLNLKVAYQNHSVTIYQVIHP